MNAEAEGRRAAVEFRRTHHLGTHHLGTQPLGDVVALIEQTTGNDVAVVDVGPDEHGLSMRDRARGVGTDDPHTSTARRHRHEIRADAFARHLLVPVEGVREVVGEHPAAVGALS